MEKIKKSQGNIIFFAGILWGVTYIACFLVVKELSPNKTLGLILAFLPTLAFGFFIYNYIKGITSMDEVERRIQLEATSIAFTLGLLLIMTLGLLDLVVILKKEDWGYRYLVPYFFTFYFAGLFFSGRKYR